MYILIMKTLVHNLHVNSDSIHCCYHLPRISKLCFLKNRCIPIIFVDNKDFFLFWTIPPKSCFLPKLQKKNEYQFLKCPSESILFCT